MCSLISYQLNSAANFLLYNANNCDNFNFNQTG